MVMLKRFLVLIVVAAALTSGCAQLQMEDDGATPTPEPTPSIDPSPGPTPASGGNYSALQDRFAGLYDSSIDSVVSLTVYSGDSINSRGTGFVYDGEGHLVTNQHVVESAESGGHIEATFNDGENLHAEIVGTSRYNDLAVLKVDPEEHELRPVTLGDSSELREGHMVVALGNPLGFAGSMTHGIVSAMGRTMPVQGGFSIPGIIQTDAPINPGNSGGPLLDLEGNVVGVNRAKAEAENIGFAIPSDIVEKVVPVLIERGEYDYPWIGIRTVDVNTAIADEMELDAALGAEVVEVVPDSPADDAGLRSATGQITEHGIDYGVGGDVIVGIEDQPVRTIDDLLSYLAIHADAGDTVTLEIIRDGERRTVDLTLGKRPEP